MRVFSDTCFALAWYALGIFTYVCPHSHRCFQTSQEMPLRSERSERSTFVLLTYYLLSICLLLTYYLPVTYYLLIAHVLLTYYVVITHLCSCACLTYPTVLISDLSSSQVFTCKRASRSLSVRFLLLVSKPLFFQYKIGRLSRDIFLVVHFSVFSKTKSSNRG